MDFNTEFGKSLIDDCVLFYECEHCHEQFRNNEFLLYHLKSCFKQATLADEDLTHQNECKGCKKCFKTKFSL